jgi:hypothetical protein
LLVGVLVVGITVVLAAQAVCAQLLAQLVVVAL